MPLLDPEVGDFYSAVMVDHVGKDRPPSLAGDVTQRLRSALGITGFRFTTQRAAVFAYLERVESHPTADEVYQAVRKSLPKISLATVYNALEALVSAGLANKLVGGNGSARYDGRGEEHYHVRDTVTGEVRDLPVAYDGDLLTKIDPLLTQHLQREGFQVTGYRLEVLGHFDHSPCQE